MHTFVKLSDSAYCHVSNRKFELDINPSGQLVPIDQPKNIPIDENVPDFTEEVTIEQVIVPENEDNSNFLFETWQ
jgi:hypothetical protein